MARGRSETPWPKHIERALWAIAHVGLNPEVPEGDQYLQVFAQRWGGLDLTALLRAEEGTRGEESDDRLFVVYALGFTAAPQAIERLAALLQSSWVGDRWASAEGVSEARDHRALPVLCMMLTELLPEQLETYLQPQLSHYDLVRGGLPMRIEAFGDPVAVPALRHALERLVRMLDQGMLPELDGAALARATLDRKAMTQEEIERVEAVFKPRLYILLERLQSRDRSLSGGVSQEAREAADTGAQEHDDLKQAHLHNLIDFEDDIVYALGRMGALGALTGVAAAQPFHLVWAVHLVMAQVYDQYQRSDIVPALSPALEADLRERLLSTFGLTAAEQDQALALYMLTKVARIRMRYSRRSASVQ
jgi:hypothetical protein